jgi:hypothetical protein
MQLALGEVVLFLVTSALHHRCAMSKPSWLHLSIGWLLLVLGQPARPESPQKHEKAAENAPPRSDFYGDPLPAGSIGCREPGQDQPGRFLPGSFEHTRSLRRPGLWVVLLSKNLVSRTFGCCEEFLEPKSAEGR